MTVESEEEEGRWTVSSSRSAHFRPYLHPSLPPFSFTVTNHPFSFLSSFNLMW